MSSSRPLPPARARSSSSSRPSAAAAPWPARDAGWADDATPYPPFRPPAPVAPFSLRRHGGGAVAAEVSTARVETPWYTLHAGPESGGLLTGTYAIRFFDVFGHDYATAPLDAAADGARGCAAIVSALEVRFVSFARRVARTVLCVSSSSHPEIERVAPHDEVE